VAEVATTSVPNPFLRAASRPDPGAARARTEELYARHHRVVLGLCRALLRDRAEAEDAAQQSFLSAHRALMNGSEPRESAAWLATIARNECWSRIRARMREPLSTADVDNEMSTSDPVAEAIRRADLAALRQAIADLPAQQRQALLLREFGGLSYEELAGALAVTTPAIESLLFRARQGLRTRLRTAYATLSGAGWIETLARLLAGGSAPAVAKVAAVGMSTAVVTGGAAVVTPRVLHSSPPRPAKRAQQLPPVAATPAPAPILVTPVVARSQAPAAPRLARVSAVATPTDDHGSSADEHRRSSDSRDEGHQRQQGEHDGEHSGGIPITWHREQEAPAPSSAGEHSDNSEDSHDHSGGESGGRGVAATTPNPLVTVTVPTGEGAPAGQSPESGSGGDD
jgi:RNA polymerase sigma-70 factor (ECF subfamily)